MGSSFSALKRAEMMECVVDKKFDLIIIGGGITGAGIALDAVTRGMKTVVFEMQDFAGGTSSRSTKLVHGGLRYLKQLEVKMVAEVGRERAIVYENGPHVTKPEWMLLPIYKNGTFGKFSTSLGLMVYDYLAAVKRNERRKMLNREETLEKAPLIKKEGLIGGGYYVEYRTDDARLTIEVVKEAVQRGAKALNYSRVEEFLYENGKVIGVIVVDQLSGRKFKVYANKIVNASGPWADQLRGMDGSKKGKQLQHTKGIHLVIDQKSFPLKQAIYFDTPDGRMVFAIPRDGKTYVGTTDTVYDGDLIHPRMTDSDRSYVIHVINYMFPELKISEEHIESSWTGLRPLIYEEGKSASEISRKDEIWESDSGLITIAGGKLTGYRKMAEMVVNRVADLLMKEEGSFYPSCQTKNIPISGGHVGGSTNFRSFIQKKSDEGTVYGLRKPEAEKLVRQYGSNIDRVYELAAQYRTEAQEVGLPIDVFLMLVYSMEEEMTVKPVDFFIRRTGTLLFDRNWVQKFKVLVIEYMAKRLNWTADKKQEYSEELEKQLYDAVVPADKEVEEVILERLENGCPCDNGL